MEFRVISLPPFTAASSGVDTAFDFSENGRLGKFDHYFSALHPAPRDAFMPRDFLYFDEQRHGMVWLWALCGDMDTGGFETVDFEGGLYLTYVYRDGDEQEGARLRDAALRYLADSPALELDPTPGRFAMGHIITPAEVISAQGWSQMETFLPVRLKQRG